MLKHQHTNPHHARTNTPLTFASPPHTHTFFCSLARATAQALEHASALDAAREASGADAAEAVKAADARAEAWRAKASDAEARAEESARARAAAERNAREALDREV